MKNEMKTNNKTALLAIIAIFAMIAAGAAVVMASSEDVDAAAITPDKTITVDGTKIVKADFTTTKTVLINGAVNCELDAALLDAAGDYKVYLLGGASVVVKGSTIAGVTVLIGIATDATTASDKDFVTYAASTASIGNVTYALESGTMKISSDGKVGPFTISATAEKVKISGTLNATAAIVNALSSETKACATELVYYEAVGGVKAVYTENLQKTYNLEGTNSTGADVFSVLKDKIKDNDVKFVITYNDGAAKRTVFTLDKPTATANVSVSLKSNAAPALIVKTSAGSLTMVSGDATAIAGNLDGKVNGVMDKATVATATVLTSTLTDDYYVSGTFTQNADTAAAGIAILAATDATPTLVIPEGITFNHAADQPAFAGNIVVYGTIAGTTSVVAITNLYIGPNACFASTLTATNCYNIASDGTSTSLDGEVKTDMEFDDLLLGGKLTINEGKTLTITSEFGLNGKVLVVDGTLVISSGASVYGTALNAADTTPAANAILIGKTGTVVIDGVVAKNQPITIGATEDGMASTSYIGLSGIVGLDFDAVNVGTTSAPDYKLAIGGEPIKNPLTSTLATVGITATSAVVVDSLSVNTGVELTVATGMGIYGELAVNGGKFVGSVADTPVTLSKDASVEVQGFVKNIQFKVYQGVVGKTTNIMTAANASITLTPGFKAGPVDMSYISGLNIATYQETVEKVTTQYILIDGELTEVKFGEGDIGTHAVIAFAGTAGAPVETFTVSSISIVAIPKDMTVTVTNASITVLGLLTDANNTAAITNNYIGSKYTVTTTASGTVACYMPLVDALEDIDLADAKTVFVKETEIDFSFNLADKQILSVEVATLKITEDAIVVLEKGSTLAGTNAVNKVFGRLVQMSGSTLKAMDAEAYAAKTTNAAGDILYSGLIPALADAVPGSVVEISSGDTDKSLTIPEGVTVKVADTLTIGKDLTISELATLVGGAIVFNDAAATAEKPTKHAVTVVGALELSEGTIAAAANNSIDLKVSGYVTYVSETALKTAVGTIAGVVFDDDDGVVLTTFDQAVLMAPIAKADTITVIGTVSCPAAVTISKVTVKLKDADAKLVLGDVKLDDAVIDISLGTFTGNVSVDDAKVSFSDAKGTMKATGNTTKKTLTLTGEINSGYATASSGNVILNGVTVNGAANNVVFTTDEGVDVDVITGTTEVIGANTVFTNLGNVDVFNGGTLTLTSGIITNMGTIAAFKDEAAGTINVRVLYNYGTLANVDGTVNVIADPVKNAEGILTSGLVVGYEMYGLGADNGVVSGNIILLGATQFLVFVGADVDEMTINAAGGVDAAKFTAFFINQVPYMYIYGVGGAIAEATLNIPTYDIPGYVKPVGDAALNTLTGWGLTGASQVGNPALAGAEVVKSRAAFIVSPITGLSLVIDNITYKDTTANVMLTVGTHTVTYTMNPGYKMADGTTATIAMNGKTVTGQITVTPDMVGGENAITASGTVVVDQPDIPEQEKEDNTIITVLLAVLVVMVVILAIVVILRMMRS